MRVTIRVAVATAVVIAISLSKLNHFKIEQNKKLLYLIIIRFLFARGIVEI